ncbi:MAG: radical SAM protein [Candidatus Thorarchaeota archaeon]
MVEWVRLSLGTAIQIGLESGDKDPNFTTAFIMTYREGGCEANCAFCPQALESTSTSDRLARISWPQYKLSEVTEAWPPPGQFRRVCIQTICYPEVVSDVVDIVHAIRKVTKLPISVAINPISPEEMVTLRDIGVSNLGIALDAGTPEIFEEIKGELRGVKYRWNSHRTGLRNALNIFGEGHVTTHLIVGLGETEKQAAEFIIEMYEMGISVGLFAFTNIKGTSLEERDPPDLSSYRRIQVVRHLVSQNMLNANQIHENDDGSISLKVDSDKIREALSSGVAFQVTGCKGCNRPFYNERPRGPMYNYPRRMTDEELLKAIEETNLVV